MRASKRSIVHRFRCALYDQICLIRLSMALRRTAAMLLSRTLNASRAASQSELHAASAALPCTRQPQQLTSLARFVATPALQGSAQTGRSLVSRSYASEAYDSPPLGLKEALKSELEYEHDNYEPEGVGPSLSWS